MSFQQRAVQLLRTVQLHRIAGGHHLHLDPDSAPAVCAFIRQYLDSDSISALLDASPGAAVPAPAPAIPTSHSRREPRAASVAAPTTAAETPSPAASSSSLAAWHPALLAVAAAALGVVLTLAVQRRASRR